LNDGAYWRSDIDALMFPVVDHAAACAVHRKAFRTLVCTENPIRVDDVMESPKLAE